MHSVPVAIPAVARRSCARSTPRDVSKRDRPKAPVTRGVDEFALAGLTPAPSQHVKVPRVAESPAAFECKVWKVIDLPAPEGQTQTGIIGLVVGVYIDDRFIRDGLVDLGAMRPIARLGYMDYAVINAENIFSLNRPNVSANGKSAQVAAGEWDGVYR